MELQGLEDQSDSSEEESTEKKPLDEESKSKELQQKNVAGQKVWMSMMRKIGHKDLPEL